MLGAELFLDSGVLIREYPFPVKGADDRQIHPGLEIRLVEARKHPVGVVGCELRGNVLLVVGVNEADAPAAVIVEFVLVVDSNRIGPRFQLGGPEVDKPSDVLRLGVFVVLDESEYFAAFEVEDEFLRDVDEVEGDLGVTGVGLPFLEADVEVVVNGAFLDVLGSVLCSFLGECHHRIKNYLNQYCL